MVVARPSALPVRAFRVGYAGLAASIEANVAATGIVGALGSSCKRRRGLAWLAVMAVPRPSNIRADAAIAQQRLAIIIRFAFFAIV
jgi:nicotinamide mononucleotide (NMN) deamidase PncC